MSYKVVKNRDSNEINIEPDDVLEEIVEKTIKNCIQHKIHLDLQTIERWFSRLG